jgi:hypothetical protein
MAEPDYDHVPLDLDSPDAQAAVARALELAAAARRAAAEGTPQAWTDYELVINGAVKGILSESLEQTVDRLAWSLHGLATVAAAAGSYASRTAGLPAAEIDVTIRRVIAERTIGQTGRGGEATEG